MSHAGVTRLESEGVRKVVVRLECPARSYLSSKRFPGQSMDFEECLVDVSSGKVDVDCGHFGALGPAEHFLQLSFG